MSAIWASTDAIRRVVEFGTRHLFHEILFVTGIPGAGKTLCGLNVVFHATTGAAFLTGNLPLVNVNARGSRPRCLRTGR